MAEMDLVELQELVLNGAGDRPLPAHLLDAAEVIDVNGDGVVLNGTLKIVFDPETAQLIAVFGDDLAIITEDGAFILLKDFVPAVTEGQLKEVALPDGSVQDAPEFLEEYGLGSGLAEALAEIETAAGEAAVPSSTTNRSEPSRFENEALNSGDQSDGAAPFGTLRGGAPGSSRGQSESGNTDESGGSGTAGNTTDDDGDLEDVGGTEADQTASAPDLSVADALSATEDAAIPLTIDASLTDLDGSETLAITISGLPEGSQLSAGVHDEVSDAWVLTETDLPGLVLIPPTNFNGTVDLVVRAIAVESNGGARAVVSETVAIDISPEADAPILTLTDPAIGLEDSAIALDIQASLTDTNETLSITITGIPEGATLSAGTVNEDGSVTLTPDQLDGLTITPAANSADDFTLTVTATSTDGTDTATQTAELPVTVTGVADDATLETAAASGDEDSAIALSIDVTNVADGDSASVTISGIPAGAELSAGTVNDDGSVTLTVDQLDGLTITPPANSDADFTLTVAVTTTDADSGDTATVTETLAVTVDAVADTPSLTVDAASGSEDSAIALDITSALTDQDGSETLSITITGIPEGATLSAGTVNEDGSVTLSVDQLDGLTITPPANSDADFTLTVAVTTTDADSGDTATVTETLAVTVDAVADTPSLTVDAASGSEDSAIALDITSALTDQDGSETLSITITGIPEGATLSAGTVNDDGSVTLTPDQLDGLTITPAANSADDFTLTVTATSTDGTDTATQTADLPVTVTGVADDATLETAAASGDEDSAIALDIDVSGVNAGDTASVTISGIPAGAELSAGTVNEDGSVTLTVDQLDGLTITPPANSDADFTLTVAVTTTDADSGDTATVTETLAVTVDAVADTPSLTVEAASGSEDSAIALDITSALTDQDGSETLSITITGIPEGATLSAGTVNEDGSVTLTPDQLEGLTITPAANNADDFTLTVTATSTDGTDTATQTAELPITVTGVADEADLATSAASGDEDSAIALSIDVTNVADGDSASVTISGIPAGAELSAGTVNDDG
ncbi:MAG: hypothetical protein RLW87_08470, partial [Alphaproteobacteria bacterium]